MGVENRVKFKKPVIRDNDGSGFGGGDDDDMDMGDEFEGNADVADMIRDNMDGEEIDDIDEDYEFAGQVAGGGGKVNEDDLIQQEILHSNISREEWLLEVERVQARLRVNKQANDGKEWRSHMDQTKQLHE